MTSIQFATREHAPLINRDEAGSKTEKVYCSEIGHQIVQIVYEDNLPAQSQVKRVAKIVLKIAGVVPCFGSTAPHFYVTLFLPGNKGNTWDRIRASLVTGSVVLNFGTLTYWGFICLVNKLLDTPLITRKEDFSLLGFIKKIALFVLSLFLGMSTRLTSLGILFNLKERSDRTLSEVEIVVAALLAVVFRSTTTSFSIYESLSYFTNSIGNRFWTNGDQKTLLNIKSNLSDSIASVRAKTIELSQQKRHEHFPSFYEFKNEVKSDTSDREIFNSLFQETLSFSQETQNQENPVSALLYIPRKIIEIVAAVAPTALVIQNFLLTYDALKNVLIDYTIARLAYAAFSALTFCWVGYKYCSLSAGSFFQKLFTLGCSDKEKSFSEKFYPNLTFIIEILITLSAALTHDEVTEVAKFYVNPKTWGGVVFMEANFAASFLLIFNAMLDLYETALLNLSETARLDPHVRDAAMLLRKLNNLEEITTLCTQAQLCELLDDMDDNNLERVIKDPTISLKRLREIIKENRNS